MVTALAGWVLLELEGKETYEVPSESMQPTLDVADKVIADRDSYDDRDPEIEDVVIFHPPVGVERGNQCGEERPAGAACPEPTSESSDYKFIKRIAAGPGDTLSLREGHPVVNGVLAREDFIRPCGPGGECNLPVEITIPPDHYFVLGDNRGASDDSRFWGPVPRGWLVGKVTEEGGIWTTPPVLLGLALTALYLIALVIAALKKRWIFFIVGLVLSPAAVAGALMPAKPGSVWQRRRGANPAESADAEESADSDHHSA